MTIAVDLERKATKQTNKQTNFLIHLFKHLFWVIKRTFSIDSSLGDPCHMICIRNKKLSILITYSGLKILGRVGTHIVFNYFLRILKGNLLFKMHKIIYFPENLKKILGFTSKYR